MAKTYVPSGDFHNPLAAPLYGDLAGLPPLLIQVGSRETLLDDAVRMADKAKKSGVDVEIDVWPGQIHVWQIFASRLDEGEQAIQKLGTFIRTHTS
jgi:monoterpene epsilon-lactone hydrolase